MLFEGRLIELRDGLGVRGSPEGVYFKRLVPFVPICPTPVSRHFHAAGNYKKGQSNFPCF